MRKTPAYLPKAMEMGTSRVSIFSNNHKPLPTSFYDRAVLLVARELLGKLLVRKLEQQLFSGIITETEAYDSENDLGCHAKCGKTRRNQAMYGPPGHAYVYFTYGLHWCLNCVTGRQGYPAAVLIRAIIPVFGQKEMHINRGRDSEQNLSNGPAKLCQALRIDGAFNGITLCDPNGQLFITEGWAGPTDPVIVGPRVGLKNVPEPWRSLPWRFQTQQVNTLLYNDIKAGEE